MLDYDFGSAESVRNEFDFGAIEKNPLQKWSSSAEKATKLANEQLSRSTCLKNPLKRYGYNEYMAHHYAYMTRVTEVREPESYVEAAEDANWRRMRLGIWLAPRKV